METDILNDLRAYYIIVLLVSIVIIIMYLIIFFAILSIKKHVKIIANNTATKVIKIKKNGDYGIVNEPTEENTKEWFEPYVYRNPVSMNYELIHKEEIIYKSLKYEDILDFLKKNPKYYYDYEEEETGDQ